MTADQPERPGLAAFPARRWIGVAVLLALIAALVPSRNLVLPMDGLNFAWTWDFLWDAPDPNFMGWVAFAMLTLLITAWTTESNAIRAGLCAVASAGFFGLSGVFHTAGGDWAVRPDGVGWALHRWLLVAGVGAIAALTLRVRANASGRSERWLLVAVVVAATVFVLRGAIQSLLDESGTLVTAAPWMIHGGNIIVAAYLCLAFVAGFVRPAVHVLSLASHLALFSVPFALVFVEVVHARESQGFFAQHEFLVSLAGGIKFGALVSAQCLSAALALTFGLRALDLKRERAQHAIHTQAFE